MASIISANVNINGQMKQVLFFSNPNNKTGRTNMTLKASLDGGLTWPESYQTQLNAAESYGYSCLTMVDENTIGILYEGIKELYFQKIKISDLFGQLLK
jgi:sialidase-1